MREIADALRRWRAQGTGFALATVCGVRGSAPRQPGAAMAVAEGGEVVGSVSGGCVEGAVYEAAAEALRTGRPALESYGISDADAFAVGLTCGGTLDIIITPHPPGPAAALDGVLDALAGQQAVALLTVIDGEALGAQIAVWPDRGAGSLGAGGLDVAAADDARGLLAAGRGGVRHYGPRGQRRPDGVPVFVQTFAPPPRMLVFGAIDYAAALVRIGRFLGYRVTVCDARPVFATRARFPDADEVVCARPAAYLDRVAVDDRTVICVLTHDPKFDMPLLRAALRSPAAYIGAMGSRRTHDERLDQLRADGLRDADLARLHSPIGLDLGSRTPEETAVSIAAEIIQSHWGGSGRPLRETSGRIHTEPAGTPTGSAATSTWLGATR
ncbi:XdhC family protein [Frankia sp. AgB32]|uniref:XdhC family protein n=1 Tax=Frankia sp. AgB32 TaxID=631119 RepID=UPI00200C49C8|nr:XdhC/CoxI family protein [Frankia sp. AgB32]MCK9895990.1 XdhC family protein [Frankia sp. AgB32]